jgi:hypothetical protein
MRVTMMLADSAQAVAGKLYVLGGGWSITGPEPAPSAIAIKLDVPWDQAEVAHRWTLALVDADGTPVFLPAPDDGQQPLRLEGEIEVVRGAESAPGIPLDWAMAINIGPLPLPPGQRYVWELSIDGESRPDWHLAFSTRPAPADA